VRSEAKGKAILEKYPSVRIVYGVLEDADVIEKEAAAADMVIHTAESADNVPSAVAIAKGLAAGHTAEKPGYWIQLSGTGILMWYDIQNNRWGEAPLPEQAYNDLAGIDRILTLPDSAPHRDVEKIVKAANSPSVRTLVVAPPCIYGVGRGPVNKRSIQVPDMVAFALEKGFAPVIGSGAAEWDFTHVHDIGRLFVLAAEATQDPGKKDDPEIFGPKGHFFVDASVIAWSDVARRVAEAAYAKGYLPAPLTKATTPKEAIEQGGIANASWGLNSKGVGERAAKYLGWKPTSTSLADDIPGTVEIEAKRMRLEPHEKVRE
jgi:hypothetical protein